MLNLNILSIDSCDSSDIPSFRAFQGLCINEFKGLQFDCQHSFDVQTGEQVGESINFYHFNLSMESSVLCKILKSLSMVQVIENCGTHCACVHNNSTGTRLFMGYLFV